MNFTVFTTALHDLARASDSKWQYVVGSRKRDVLQHVGQDFAAAVSAGSQAVFSAERRLDSLAITEYSGS